MSPEPPGPGPDLARVLRVAVLASLALRVALDLSLLALVTFALWRLATG